MHDDKEICIDGHKYLLIEACDNLPVDVNIQVSLHELIETVYRVMKKTEHFYRSGRTIVYVRMDGSVEFLSKTDLIIELSRFIRWKVETDTRDQIVNLPARIEKYLVNTSFVLILDEVRGFAKHPLINQNGHLEIGFQRYDKSRMILFDYEINQYSRFHLGVVSDDEARKSVDYIVDIFSDFPIRHKTAISKLLCALLTAVFRAVLTAAPMICISSDHAGTGKSYLCDLLGLISGGEKPLTRSLPTSEDECVRSLIATLRSAPTAVLFDNAVGGIRDFNSLCTCLTQSEFSDRLVGTSQVISVTTRALFLVSGNCIEPLGDLRRRVMQITLYSQNNAERKFKHPDLIDYVKQNRSALVFAIQKIAANYLQRGVRVDCRSIASYGAWSLFCREPLLNLGYPDPACDMLTALSEDDPVALLRFEIVEHLYQIFAEKEFGVVHIIRAVNADPTLRTLLPRYLFDSKQCLNSMSLGAFIRSLSENAPTGFVVMRTRKKPRSLYSINKVH